MLGERYINHRLHVLVVAGGLYHQVVQDANSARWPWKVVQINESLPANEYMTKWSNTLKHNSELVIRHKRYKYTGKAMHAYAWRVVPQAGLTSWLAATIHKESADIAKWPWEDYSDGDSEIRSTCSKSFNPFTCLCIFWGHRVSNRNIA